MQRKYLGDAEDCFKWDYRHFLVQALRYPQLQISTTCEGGGGG